jgi:hypothetical protein
MNDVSRQQLEAYIDGMLTGSDRQRFEQNAAGDPEVRQIIEDQRRIDSTLKRLFPLQASMGAQAALERVNPTRSERLQVESAQLMHSSHADEPRSWRRWLAVAAVFTICAYALWANRSFYFPQPTHRIVAQSKSLEKFYRAKVDGGYQPQIAFTGNAALESMIRARFGEPVSLSALSAKFSIGGVENCDMLSDRTLALMMMIEGREVIVLIDEVTAAPHAPLSASCRLHAFEAQIGKLKLVEVTPWPEPRALALFKATTQQSMK